MSVVVAVNPMDDDDEVCELKKKTTDELLRDLCECADMTVHWINRMAKVLYALQCQGFSEVRIRSSVPILPWLNRINRGELLAGLLVKLDCDKYKLDYLGSLSLTAQQAIVEDKLQVPVVTSSAGGVEEHLLRDPCTIPRELLPQVIDKESGRIRSVGEQAVLIGQENKKQRVKPQRVGPMEIDETLGIARVKGVVLSYEDIAVVYEILGGMRDARKRKSS